MEDRIIVEGLNGEVINFLENDNLSANYFVDFKLSHFKWKQRSIGDAYREPFLIAGEFAKTHTTNFFLTDIRNQGIVGPEDRKWFETVALPLSIERGLQKAGVIFEGDIFKMYYINILLKHFVSKGVPMKFFKDEAKAVEWFLKDK